LKKLKEEKGGKKLIIKFTNVDNKNLEKIDYLESVENNEYIIRLTSERNCQNVISDLFKRGFEIETFEVIENTLNDIFIEME